MNIDVRKALEVSLMYEPLMYEPLMYEALMYEAGVGNLITISRRACLQKFSHAKLGWNYRNINNAKGPDPVHPKFLSS